MQRLLLNTIGDDGALQNNTIGDDGAKVLAEGMHHCNHQGIALVIMMVLRPSLRVRSINCNNLQTCTES